MSRAVGCIKLEIILNNVMVIRYLLYAECILLQDRSLQIMNELCLLIATKRMVERLWESGGLHYLSVL